MIESFRDRFQDQQKPRAAFSTFPNVNKLGTGELLPLAAEELRKAVKVAGWEISNMNPIRSKQLRAFEAYRFCLSNNSRSYILPLCAKNYPIRIDDHTPWFSVAESVIHAAMQYEDNVVLTYLKQYGKIFATHAGAATLDDHGGDYLRFNERYYGWPFKDWLQLEKWLETPDRLNYQARLEP